MTGKLIATLNAEAARLHHDGYRPGDRRMDRIAKALDYLRSRTR